VTNVASYDGYALDSDKLKLCTGNIQQSIFGLLLYTEKSRIRSELGAADYYLPLERIPLFFVMS